MMAFESGSSVYPLNRCKIVHLVRHAQGEHNAAFERGNCAHASPQFFDAQLSPLGWQQVDNQRNYVRSSGLYKRVELVVVSPLMRTMQTAGGLFGGDDYVEGTDAVPLMVENTNRPAISSSNSPPFVAVELCRERLGVNWCDKRRNIKEYKSLFPAIDFSLIENDEDTLWTPDVRENNEQLSARGLKFFDWLCRREEKEIAVVTHSAFLENTLVVYGDNYNSSLKSEICKPSGNCEVRSIVLVDKRYSLGSMNQQYQTIK